MQNPLNQEMIDQIMREIGLEHVDERESTTDMSSFNPAVPNLSLITRTSSR